MGSQELVVSKKNLHVDMSQLKYCRYVTDGLRQSGIKLLKVNLKEAKVYMKEILSIFEEMKIDVLDVPWWHIGICDLIGFPTTYEFVIFQKNECQWKVCLSCELVRELNTVVRFLKYVHDEGVEFKESLNLIETDFPWKQYLMTILSPFFNIPLQTFTKILSFKFYISYAKEFNNILREIGYDEIENPDENGIYVSFNSKGRKHIRELLALEQCKKYINFTQEGVIVKV